MTETEQLDFYRDAYEKARARADALEKSNTRLYEREANHTEAYGMVCQERDQWIQRAQKAECELEELKACPARGGGTTPEQVTNMARALAHIRNIADFPNTPGGDMLPELMGRLESIWKIANGEIVPGGDVQRGGRRMNDHERIMEVVHELLQKREQSVNNDYQNIADMLPSMLLGGEKCPLCGNTGMHQHTPAEIVIYRNGMKYGRSLAGPVNPSQPGGAENLCACTTACVDPKRQNGTECRVRLGSLQPAPRGAVWHCTACNSSGAGVFAIRDGAAVCPICLSEGKPGGTASAPCECPPSECLLKLGRHCRVHHLTVDHALASDPFRLNPPQSADSCPEDHADNEKTRIEADMRAQRGDFYP